MKKLTGTALNHVCVTRTLIAAYNIIITIENSQIGIILTFLEFYG